MKIGLVGYQGSGKSTLFHWLTGVAPDPSQAHVGQSAMAPIPDSRVEPLCAVYHPKKVTMAALEIVDTPGLSRTHEGNASRLALLREAGALVLVVAGFGGADPRSELRSFEEDLLLADMEIVSGRIDRLKESIKKPRPNRDEELAELAGLENVLVALEAGKHLADAALSDEEKRAIRAFRLFSEKPKLVLVNLSDDDSPARFEQVLGAGQPLAAVPVRLEQELAGMSAADRAEFEAMLPSGRTSREQLLRRIMDVSGLVLYFTAGDKEVRTWLLRQGGTALEAADNIHTDLARGFIRAETMRAEDLIRLGSEREVKAHHLMRQEPKDYVVVDGDVLHIRFSV
jgi:hypothetical protein